MYWLSSTCITTETAVFMSVGNLIGKGLPHFYQKCNSSTDIWEKMSEISTSVPLQSSAPLSHTHHHPQQSSHAPILHNFSTDSQTISCSQSYRCQQTSIHPSTETCNLSWGHLSRDAYLYSSDDLYFIVWMNFSWEERRGHLWKKSKGQAVCLLPSKMMNSEWEQQRKQRGVLPTSVSLNLNKSPTGGVLCSSYSWRRGQLCAAEG